MTPRIKLEVEGATHEEVERIQEIMHALITCGGLFGVKGGRTILHFDSIGVFQGVELQYWPWRRKNPKVGGDL